MKKLLNIGLVLLLSLGFSACFTEDQMGLPEKVYFSNEGGELVLTANDGLGYISIVNAGPETQFTIIRERDSTIEIRQYQWITITHTLLRKDFRIAVSPNTTGRKRKVILEAYSGPDYATIKVEQAK